jgi:hypothetical protein
MSAIATGDLIVPRVAHNWIGTITQEVTDSPYVHAGLAYWMDGRLFIAELNGGRNHLTPISQLTDYDVYAQPDGLVDVAAAIDRWLDAPIDYAYAAFVVIGILDWLRLTTFVHARRLLVCSGWCVAVWETAGWGEHTRILSPAALARLCTLKLEVRQTQPASAGFSLGA